MSSATAKGVDLGAVRGDHLEKSGDQPPTTARTTIRQKLPSLTGSRFWAAFLVFLFHSSLPSDLAPFSDETTQHLFAAVVSKAGWLGVSYFFILSGFIMVWSARDGDTIVDFYLRRFAKIYPTHCLTWAAAFLVGAVSVGEYRLWASNLFLVNTWVDDVKYFFVANRPSWSLCIEAFFYLIFPVIFKAMKFIPQKLDFWILGLLVVTSVLLQTYIYMYIEPNRMMGAFQISQHQFWVSYIFPPSRLFEFLSGMFIARLFIHGRALLLTKTMSLLLLVAAYIGAMCVPFQFGLSVIYIVPVSLLIVSIARDDLEEKKTPLSGETSVWLGEISYAFYMVHFLVLFFFLNLV